MYQREMPNPRNKENYPDMENKKQEFKIENIQTRYEGRREEENEEQEPPSVPPQNQNRTLISCSEQLYIR